MLTQCYPLGYRHVLFISRAITDLATSILKSLVILVIWLAIVGAIYSRIAPFFALKLYLLKYNNQLLVWRNRSNCWRMKNNFRNFLQTSSLLDQQTFVQTKKSCIEATEFCDFKMDVLSGSWTSCRAILVWNHIFDFKSRKWFQTKWHSPQFVNIIFKPE